MEAAFAIRAMKDLFGFPFRDEKKGTKFLIGSLIFISGFYIPLVPWIALWGYSARIARNSLEGQELRLPEWDHWGSLMKDGLKLFVTGLLLSAPSVLLFVIGFGAYFGGFFGAIITQETAGDQAAAPFFLLMMLAMFFMFFTMTLGTLLSVAAWFFTAPVGAHVVATGRLGAMLEVRQWGRIMRGNLGGFVLVFFTMFGLWAVMYLAFSLLYMTILLCAFLPVVLAPLTLYMLAITSVMAGQAYREGREKLETLSDDVPLAAVPVV